MGPVEVRLDNVDRKCGPEEEMAFREPAEQWERRLAELQASICNVLDLPPLIAEGMGGTLRNEDGTFRFLVADGTHRLEALRRLGRESFHMLVWFET